MRRKTCSCESAKKAISAVEGPTVTRTRPCLAGLAKHPRFTQPAASLEPSKGNHALCTKKRKYLDF
jgi:hypothetical protein